VWVFWWGVGVGVVFPRVKLLFDFLISVPCFLHVSVSWFVPLGPIIFGCFRAGFSCFDFNRVVYRVRFTPDFGLFWRCGRPPFFTDVFFRCLCQSLYPPFVVFFLSFLPSAKSLPRIFFPIASPLPFFIFKGVPLPPPFFPPSTPLHLAW